MTCCHKHHSSIEVVSFNQLSSLLGYLLVNTIDIIAKKYIIAKKQTKDTATVAALVERPLDLKEV